MGGWEQGRGDNRKNRMQPAPHSTSAARLPTTLSVQGSVLLAASESVAAIAPLIALTAAVLLPNRTAFGSCSGPSWLPISFVQGWVSG